MQTPPYPPGILEEELKNKVAADWFGAFDCTRILGKVDFCVASREGRASSRPPDAESLVWAEAKRGRAALDFALVQLILTIGKARTFDRHLPPRFLAAFNAAGIAFLPYAEVAEVFYQNDFNWNVAPSDHTTREFGDLYRRVVGLLDAQTLSFDFARDAADLRRFIRRTLAPAGGGRNELRPFPGGSQFTATENTGADAINCVPPGRAVAPRPPPPARIQITKSNFTHIYQRWRETVMPTILMPDWAEAKRSGILDADFFLADIFSTDNAAVADRLNVLLMEDRYRQIRGNDAFGFQLFTEISFSDGQRAHRAFWRRYARPPRKEYWEYIVNRRDLLVPQDVRERKGSFFTPQIWVEKSQEYLARAFGEDWQDTHYVWDCCAGTGNLLAGLTNKYRVFASTLDQADVDAMRQRIAFGANLLDAHIFQFDFLNDPFTPVRGGGKLPNDLYDILSHPDKRQKLIIYINPPYAEATTAPTKGGAGMKPGVAKGSAAHTKYKPLIGAAANELFTLFLMRIHDEISGCAIGQFSTLKHLRAQNFRTFRAAFCGNLLLSFLVPSDTFDNVKGKFPIGFFVWRLGERTTRLRTVLEGAPVVRLTGHEFEGLKGYRALQEAIYESQARVNHMAIHPQIGRIDLTKHGILNSLKHGFGRAKLCAFAAIPELIVRGVIARYRDNWKGRGYGSYVLAAPFAIGDEEYCAFIIVNVHLYGEKHYYLHEVGKLADLKNIARDLEVPGASSAELTNRGRSQELRRGYSPGGDIRSLAHSIFAVNWDDGIFPASIANVYDRRGEPVGRKTIEVTQHPLAEWIRGFGRPGGEVVGYERIQGSDVQNSPFTNIVNSPSEVHATFLPITLGNLIPACVHFAARLVVEDDWLVHNDLFSCPSEAWADDATFQLNCLVYTLFSGKNRIRSADGTNHWIPFTEEEVGAQGCFASHFMSEVLGGRDGRADAPRPPHSDGSAVAGRPPYQGELFAAGGGSQFIATGKPGGGADAINCVPPTGAKRQDAASPAARAVLDAGRALWRYYHAQRGANPNASYYDIRLHFQGVKKTAGGKEQMNPDSRDAEYTRLLAALRAAHRDLARRIEPKVYAYGFLRR